MKKLDLRLNLIFFLILVIGVCSYIFSWKYSRFSDEIFSILLAFAGFTLGSLFTFIVEHKNDLIVAYHCYLTSTRKQDIYISLSYLFRIKIEGGNKYLMVRGKKIRRQYQPVGGVYKRHQSSEGLFQDLNARPAKNDEANIDDLRFYVKGNKVPKVISWFISRKNREVDVWREFYEEMVDSGILTPDHFRYIKPEYLKSHYERLITRKGIDEKQFLIYDIYTISFTVEQQAAIRGLYNEAAFSENYAFVDEDCLDKELFTHGGEEYQLGIHAKYLK